MTDFKNEFTWSFSRHRTFTTCERKYYYNYYGNWGGWDAKADEEVKKLYMLKNMTSLPMLAGSLVHNEVERILKSVRNGWNFAQEDSEKNIITTFKRSWSQSKNKDWVKNVKHNTNLFEHYYEQEISNDRLFEIRDIMIDSIKGFYDSDSFAFIKTLAITEWLSIEALDSFEIEDTKIWVKLDFAARHGERAYIYDWKTGKEVKEDENQLAVYTLYAMEKWDVEMKQVRLFDVYLMKQIPVKVKPSVALINNVMQIIQQSIEGMKSLLDDVSENKASIGKFPKVNDATEDSWPCSYCNFKEVCYAD